MKDHTRIAADTEVFGKISPAIFQAILDTIPALGSVLNWEPLACVFLADVLRQISLVGNPLKISHIVFARLLWGESVSDVAAERRLGRCVSSLTKCQAMSGCYAIWIERGGRAIEDGETRYYRTTYWLREFFDVFAEVQKIAVEQDLMALSMRDRKYTQLAIVQRVCDARQYQKIPARARQQRHFEIEKVKREPLLKVEALPKTPPSHVVHSEALKWYRVQLREYLLAIGSVGDDFERAVSDTERAIRSEVKAAMETILNPKPVMGSRRAGGRR